MDRLFLVSPRKTTSHITLGAGEEIYKFGGIGLNRIGEADDRAGKAQAAGMYESFA